MLSHPAFWNSSLSDSLCSYFLNPPHSPLTNSLIYIFLLILPTLIAQIPTHHHSLQVTGPANSPVALSFHKAKYVTPVPHISSVQSLIHVWLFATPWTVARQASLSITNSQSLLKLMYIKSVMPSNHLILCHSSVFPFSSCPQSFPASGSFQMRQLSTSGGQSIGVSASTSVLPMNTQDWSPLG